MVTKPQSLTPPVQDPVCANCGAPLYGEYCYACGQPVKGLIRHLSGVLGDVFDTVLNIDSRVIRTLPALYLKPGFLSREYFAGRRVRYVTPFRLMFFLALIAFFVMQLAFDSSTFNFGDRKSANQFRQAHTQAEVIAQERQALDKINADLANPHLPSIARDSLVMARDKIKRDAGQRIADLQRTTARTTGAGSVTAPAPAGTVIRPAGKGDLNLLDDATWDQKRDPVHVGWLPGFANDWINRAGQRMHDNVTAMRRGTPEARRAAVQRLVGGALSVLPQTMFVLLPLFALILKVFYIFKRRLYMEHLIVALHSHAFIFLSILVLFALSALRTLAPQSAWLGVPLGLASAAAWIWLFVYLWLMQKRVYGQGWFFTTVKYWCVGICYSVLLSFSIGMAFLLSLAQA
ncbi:MAG TPA: DUF3667 domain-containing protein [Rhodanobacteraceae bacterium]|nr:DUF3667 domain-containing protein [Rhodanobacteraceae bacterium]